MLRFISYLRVSTDDQADYGTGLETQSLENRLYVERLQGTLVGEESDPGVSGAIYPRPGLTRALERLQRGEADALIVHRVDRLGRKMSVPSLVLETIQDLGCKLYTVEDGEVTDTTTILFALRSGMAVSEYKRLIENMKQGKRRMTERGLQPNRNVRPYGYHIVQKIENGIVQPNAGQYLVIEAEAEVVRLIFTLYDTAYSLRGILRELVKRGIPAMKEGSHWHRGSVQQILRSTAYIGYLMWGKTRNVKKDGKVRTVKTDPVQWLRLELPPIIDMAQWARIQKRFGYADGEGTRCDRRHLFSGLLRCPVCGRRMVFNKRSSGQKVYQCPYRAPSVAPPGQKCAPTGYDETTVSSALRWLLALLMSMQESEIAQRYEVYLRSRLPLVDTQEMERISGQLVKVQKQMQDTIRAQIAGEGVGIPATHYNAELLRVQAEKEVLESRLKELQSLQESQYRIKQPERIIHDAAMNMQGILMDKEGPEPENWIIERRIKTRIAYESMTDLDRNRLLHEYIEKIIPAKHFGDFQVYLWGLDGVNLLDIVP